MEELKNAGVQDKILKYEAFVNDVLKEDLKHIHEQLEKKNSELAEWIQLQRVLKTLITTGLVNDSSEGFKTKMDIGTNIYVQVHVPDVSSVLIDVGCDLHVEYSISEALTFIQRKIELLERQILVIRQKSAEIKARIKLVLHGIQELSNLK